MPNDDWVFSLNLANIALGVGVLLVVLVALYGVAWELVSRRRKSHDKSAHSLPVPGLGMTMADGGERAKPLPEQPAAKKRH